MSPRTARSVLRLACLASILALGATQFARAQSKIAGTYTPSPQRLEVQVTAWGEDCGPRPQSQTLEGQGPVKVTEEGAHLTLKFSDRTLKTNGCWSPNPAVKLVSATSAGGRFQAECKTAPNDAKREIGRYVVSAADGKLELSEESDYDWQLKTSHCVAKLRMSQTLTSTSLPAPPVQTAPDAGLAPAPACVPGPAARLRLRPSDARITPGERVCFSVRATDAAGCAVELPAEAVSYSLVKPAGAQGTLGGACFRAASSTALAEGMFKVVASGAGLRAEADVSVSAPDLSDITARRGSSGNGSLSTAEVREETTFESGVRAVATGSHGMLWLGAVIAVLAGALSVIAITALRVARKQMRRAEQESLAWKARASGTMQAADQAVPPSAPPAPVVTGPQRICPQCRRGYPPGTERCANDGATLMDYSEFVKRAETQAGPRFCPECGEQLLRDSIFCGRCGHKVAS